MVLRCPDLNWRRSSRRDKSTLAQSSPRHGRRWPLFLLVQHSSFRISRSEFFCPTQECSPDKPTTSLGRLAANMQTLHGATKEEMTDMVRYCTTKPLLKPAQSAYTTRSGHRGYWAGCSYVSGKEYHISGRLNKKHKSVTKDIERLGRF
jgi:hypothetical protein